MAHLLVLHHGKCFDGAVSAALAIRLIETLAPRPRTVETRGLAHGAGAAYAPGTFHASENAVVDFRYAADPALTWWFDHHGTTFATADDRAHFLSDTSGRRFFDPDAPSCAGLIARVARERFGVDLAARDAELLHWADIIDAARFESPAVAVALVEPALQLMTWLEAAAEPADEAAVVAELCAGTSLATLVRAPLVAEKLAPTLAAHREQCAIVASRMERRGGVALIDLLDLPLPAVNKFIPYATAPDLTYTVTLLAQPGKTKLAIGSNPWRQDARRHHIGDLCQRHGGGGHAGVGAISLPAGRAAEARALAQTIVALLAG